jgi:hypothetical protein
MPAIVVAPRKPRLREGRHPVTRHHKIDNGRD